MLPREEGLLKPKYILVGNENKEDYTNNSTHVMILFFKIKCIGRGKAKPPNSKKLEFAIERPLINLCCHSNPMCSHR